MENMNILCLTETWLTDDITNEGLFLKEFMVYRNDRKTDNHKTKHGCVLIAVRNSISQERVELKSTDEYVVVKIEPKKTAFLICCCYNPPKASPYWWSETSIIDLLNELKTHAEKNCETIILSGITNHINHLLENIELNKLLRKQNC